MNLDQAKELALNLMNQHGLISQGWNFKLDRAVRRLGATKFSTKTISLSNALTALNDEGQVKNTILHEIAHALVGSGHGHNNVWRYKAVSIGCNGQRCTNSVVKVQSKYKILCNNCNDSWDVFRRPKSLVTCFHSTCGRASLNKLVLVEVY